MQNDIIDSITGSVSHRSYPCRIARADESRAAASPGWGEQMVIALSDSAA
jgi:hypothetical protein